MTEKENIHFIFLEIYEYVKIYSCMLSLFPNVFSFYDFFELM